MLINRRLLLSRWLRKPPPSAGNTTKWSIGIYTGTSPVALGTPDSLSNPVLTADDVTDVPATWIADPFMLKNGCEWFMFFEVLNSYTQKGDIGFATSADGFRWIYGRIVLDEPFHLSYPYVFRSGQHFYMTPESHKTASIRLYRAVQFPTRWIFVKSLLAGQRYVDPSVFHYGDNWWIFTANVTHDTLRLYYSPTLEGPWSEHPASPVVRQNPHIARPGGRVVVAGRRIFRYAQDDYPKYGRQVWAFEVEELTTTSYQERQVSALPIIRPSGRGWNRDKMHHIDAHQIAENEWIACVDGKGTY